jgi:hypothetical protein
MTTAQMIPKKVWHQAEFNCIYSQVPASDYSMFEIWDVEDRTDSKGGSSIAVSVKYSLVLKKWFLDCNAEYNYSNFLQRIVFEDESALKSMDLRSRLSFVKPEFYFGRFFKLTSDLRMSFGIGVGYNLLLPRKTKEFVATEQATDATDNFYEGNISYFRGAPLALSTSIGFYPRIKVNELCIKLILAANGNNYSDIELYKIVNYQRQLIFSDTGGFGSLAVGISLGYRINNFRPNVKHTPE